MTRFLPAVFSSGSKLIGLESEFTRRFDSKYSLRQFWHFFPPSVRCNKEREILCAVLVLQNRPFSITLLDASTFSSLVVNLIIFVCVVTVFRLFA